MMECAVTADVLKHARLSCCNCIATPSVFVLLLVFVCRSVLRGVCVACASVPCGVVASLCKRAARPSCVFSLASVHYWLGLAALCVALPPCRLDSVECVYRVLLSCAWGLVGHCCFDSFLAALLRKSVSLWLRSRLVCSRGFRCALCAPGLFCAQYGAESRSPLALSFGVVFYSRLCLPLHVWTCLLQKKSMSYE
jgi:hypothetical protein